jgi:hypothetical protein
MTAIFGVNFDGSVFVKLEKVPESYYESCKEDKSGFAFSKYVASVLGPFPERFDHVSTQQQVQLKMDLVQTFTGGAIFCMVYIDSS